MCAVQIKPRDADPVSIRSPGRLEQVDVAPGQWVNEGDVLAQLDNSELDLSVEEASRQERNYFTQLVNLEERKHDDPAIAGQIPTIQEELQSTRENLESLPQVPSLAESPGPDLRRDPAHRGKEANKASREASYQRGRDRFCERKTSARRPAERRPLPGR